MQIDPADYLGLVHKVARRIKQQLPRHVELDDLVGFGTLGLFDAISKYEPGKGAFATYAYWRIRGTIQDSLRAASRDTSWNEVDRAMPAPNDVSQHRLDTLIELGQRLGNDRQLLLIVLRYFCELKLKDAGEVMGLTEAHANSIHLRAMAKLRRQNPEE